jgi:membrane-associated phospholipid phosphatase
MRRFITLAFAAVLTYILFPAAPPWMASDMGLISDIQRTTPYGWELIGGGTADLLDKGQTSVNLVAAVPSLHTAMTVLVAMFLWGRVRPSLRPLLALYPVAMGFTLMATGEHWAFDLLLGVLYAWAVMAGWSWWERRRVAQPAAT